MSISQTVSYAQNFCPLPAFGLHCNALHCIGEYECTTVHAHREASFEWKKVEGDAALHPSGHSAASFSCCSIVLVLHWCRIVLLLQECSIVLVLQAGVLTHSGKEQR